VSLPVYASAVMPSQVTFMDFGVMSTNGTGFGIFINSGTESANTILSSDKAPKPTPF